ncbi:MAG TPA: hypothetical protein VFR86_09580 [Burkholderiaceae bacterium]|nr:hypothetical protein [Burkholderiaceae bacterium]
MPYDSITGAPKACSSSRITPDGSDDDGERMKRSGLLLMGAIKTVIIADAVMSLDNVIAVAGAAKGDIWLVVFGIVVSIPIVVRGSKLVLKLMDRFPVVITLGGALLGWIAGDMIVTDIALQPYLDGAPNWLHYVSAVVGAVLVVSVGLLLAGRIQARLDRELVVDLAPAADNTSIRAGVTPN